MKNKLIFGLLALFILGCDTKSNYKYWDISKFTINQNALKNKDEVKLIYWSRGPDENRDMEYYYHLIVVSQTNGDTINVLTIVANEFKKEDGDKVFNYFATGDDAISRLSHMDADHLEKIINGNSIDTSSLKKITKVIRDPKFDYLADNHFPTVIGIIGAIKANEEK